MAVIARDAKAADALVYAWPYPIGGEPFEVSCGADEVAVVCPAWTVGDRLGPGHHRWRSPDPSRPTSVYFVLSGPVEVPFDVVVSFVVPATQQPVRLRASGSLLARCFDPALLVAQFVGLPTDDLNGGLMRSVARSAERLAGRVLTRRVLAAGTPMAVLEPSIYASIVEELAAYNPAHGAVTGLMFARFNQLSLHADDLGHGAGGAWPGAHGAPSAWSAGNGAAPYVTGGFQAVGYPAPAAPGYGALNAYDATPTSPPYTTGSFAAVPAAPAGIVTSSSGAAVVSGEIGGGARDRGAVTSERVAVSGEIGVVSGEIGASRAAPAAPPPPTGAGLLPAGARVLLPSPDGSLHAAVVVRHDQGYYQVEIGSSGEHAWVPTGQVIAEP